jgi:3-oxoacyl-[acyl-carrier protein] reductase
MKRLADKVTLVTGAARGIGKEIALTFAREGASIGIVDVLEDDLNRVSQAIKDTGVKVLASKVDVSNKSEIRRFVDLLTQELGTIDILVNNAAYLRYGPFLDFEEEEWDKIMAVGFKGYFLCSQVVAREMIKNRRGRIINLASAGGQVGFPMGTAYSASKGGVIALTKGMAVELAPYGITVNAISPGPTNTELFKAMADEEAIKARVSRIPLGRLGNTEDMAKAALFLASDDSQYITGHILNVDGGFLAAGMVAKA